MFLKHFKYLENYEKNAKKEIIMTETAGKKNTKNLPPRIVIGEKYEKQMAKKFHDFFLLRLDLTELLRLPIMFQLSIV